MFFASTYALGKLATLYYDSGRTVGLEALKSKIPTFAAGG